MIPEESRVNKGRLRNINFALSWMQLNIFSCRYPVSIKSPGAAGIPEVTLSNSSTLRKSVRRSDPLSLQRAPEQDYTTVIYSFWDEEVPYRTKAAGAHITLKQFKELLPRKGSYR